MLYHRLTQAERYHMEALLDSCLSLRQIARQLGRHASTISRELKRNTSYFGKVYSPRFAELVSLQNKIRRHRKKRKIQGETETYVQQKILQDWSPQQISGRMHLEQRKDRVSHSTIYRYLEQNKAQGGYLWKHLRILRKLRKDRKKPQWKPYRRLTERVFIEDRPQIVNERKRLGDYERDSLLGTANGSLCLTLVDRTSRLLKLAWLPKKQSNLVHQATLCCLHNEPVKTITNDNGAEFSMYQKTADILGVSIYFTHAYRSWERGTNENLNGLIRQYLPRNKPIQRLSPKEIHSIENLLNMRPRKCLGYRTPLEVHTELKSSGVALDT